MGYLIKLIVLMRINAIIILSIINRYLLLTNLQQAYILPLANSYTMEGMLMSAMECVKIQK